MTAREILPRPDAVTLIVLGAAAAAGAAAGFGPMVTLVASAAVCTAVYTLVHAARLPALFLSTLGVLLVGYVVMGRGAAYVGHYPVFVGELVLTLGAVAVLLRGRPQLAVRSPIAWGLVAFGAWGAVQTVPYLHEYGTDTLRDAVVWGYAAYALLVAWALARTGWTAEVPARYAGLARVLPAVVPIAWFAQRYGEGILPVMPGGDALLISFKPGDAAVHLAGAMTFTLLRLPAATPEQRPWRSLEWLWWACWFVALAIVVTYSRGGLMAIVVAGGIVMTLRRRVSVWRPAVLAVLMAALFAASRISIQVREGRTLSAAQVLSNVESIAGHGEAPGDLDGTKEWRLRWWTTIITYTIHGPYFWTGKGFGVNLADSDGFQTDLRDHTLRSPHNGHLTILARTGVPGFVVWVVLQLSFAAALLRAYVRLRDTDEDWWARTYLWIFAYWAAFMVNGAFDVFLEGPQGGIWFWSVFGFGLAALHGRRGLPGGASGGVAAGR